MQQGRGGMGSHKHGVSGHATQSPRLRLAKKLAAERGEYDTCTSRRPLRPAFANVRDAFDAQRKPRRLDRRLLIAKPQKRGKNSRSTFQIARAAVSSALINCRRCGQPW